MNKNIHFVDLTPLPPLTEEQKKRKEELGKSRKGLTSDEFRKAKRIK